MPGRATRPPGQARPARAIAHARSLFLDDAGVHGCAETSYLALADAFGLTEVVSSAPAMALNGGVAYGGNICGAISGAALAVGLLAERRIRDHRAAKRVARELVAEAMDRFAERHGALDCRDLIGTDLRAPGQHDAFMASDLAVDEGAELVERSLAGRVHGPDRRRPGRPCAARGPHGLGCRGGPTRLIGG